MTTTVNLAADTGLPGVTCRDAKKMAQMAEESLDFPIRVLVELHRLTAAQKREVAGNMQSDGRAEFVTLAELVLKMAERQEAAA